MTKYANGRNHLSVNLYRHNWVQMLLTGLLLPSLTITTPVLANPLGGIVVHGDVVIGTGSAGNLQINQASSQAIIDWSSFSGSSCVTPHSSAPSRRGFLEVVADG